MHVAFGTGEAPPDEPAGQLAGGLARYAEQRSELADCRSVAASLRPGGIVVGRDTIETPGRRDQPLGDFSVLIDVAGLVARRCAAGLVFLLVEQDEDRFGFV